MIDEQADAEPTTLTYKNAQTGKILTATEMKDGNMANIFEPAGYREALLRATVDEATLGSATRVNSATPWFNKDTRSAPCVSGALGSNGFASQNVATRWYEDFIAAWEDAKNQSQQLTKYSYPVNRLPITSTLDQPMLLSLQQKLDAAQREIARLALANAELLSQIHAAPNQRLSESWEHLSDVITPNTAIPQPQTAPNGKSIIPFTALRQQRQTIGLTTELP